MSDQVLIKAEHVSKKFCRSLRRSFWYGFRDIGAELNPFRRNSQDRGLLQNSEESPPNTRLRQEATPWHALKCPAAEQARRGASAKTPPLWRPFACFAGIPERPAPGVAGAATGGDAPLHFPPLRRDEFWALRDVSFELKRGECLGLIGHNGAGKSTLLRLLNGLIKPDTGRIEVRGRVGALIELSAGFNPILTGRENIYNQGAVLGFSRKEIAGKLDAILEFAEIGDFIDMAVQNYSSGMRVRLGFAVCAQMNPDVLLIDEVMAVGDIRFQFKCLNAMADLMKNAAVIFVSHAMPQVFRVSTEVMLMEQGKAAFHGSNIGEGIERYYQMAETGSQTVSGSGEATLERFEMTAAGKSAVGPEVLQVPYGADLTARMRVRLAAHIPAARVQLVIWNQAMSPVADVVDSDGRGGFLIRQNEAGIHSIQLTLPRLALNAGRHTLTVVVTEPGAGKVYCRHDNAGAINVSPHLVTGASFVLPAQWQVL